MIDNNEIEILAEVPDAETINTPVPGLVFADPLKWALTLSTLEGSLVEAFLAGGESTLGYIAGFADNPEDDDEVDLILRSDWSDGPAGARIPIPFQTIGLIQVL